MKPVVSSVAPLLKTLQTPEVSLHTRSRTIAAKSFPRHSRRSATCAWEGAACPFSCPSRVSRPKPLADRLGICTRSCCTCVCRPHFPCDSTHESMPYSEVDFRDVLVIVCTRRGPEPLPMRTTKRAQSARGHTREQTQLDPRCVKQPDTKESRRERSMQNGTRRCDNQHHDNTTQPQHSTQRRRPNDEAR